MKNKKDASQNSTVFWKMAKDYVDHRLPEIRKVSPNTVKAYRDSLNKYIDYLEAEKNIRSFLYNSNIGNSKKGG